VGHWRSGNLSSRLVVYPVTCAESARSILGLTQKGR
jgi:hypothetical protein